ncbi:MAG: tetratricopeptide repeat protein, partial [Caldilineaceae bacterium]|nr:tetratricopeptide repeat protein [Caldilineaceae bacterium]
MDTIENLEDQLREATDHCHRATILNQLIWALGHRDLARSTTLLEDIAALIPQEKAHTRSDRTVIANYHVGKALLDSYCGRYGDAIVSAQTALIDLNADAPTDSNAQHLLRCKALEIMGICHVRLGSPSDALTNLRSALHIATEIDSQQAAATIHNGFAILYVNVGDHQNGANHFQKSLVCARAVGDRLGEARALVNLCMSYRDLGEYKQSLACGNEGLALTRELHAQRYEIGALGNLANTYLVLGESEKAFAYFQEAAQLSAQLENFPEQATTLLNMARAFLQQENHAQAKSYATLVLEIGQSHEQLGIQFESHEILAAIYKVEGDFATALQHFEAFHQIKERIFNTEAEEKLRQLEVAHRTETALRDAEIYQLRYVELQHEITERERAQKALVQAQKLDSLG